MNESTQPQTNSSDDLQAFVMIHDQDLLLACEEEDRFSGLPRMRYLFLGGRPVNKVEGRRNVVVARLLGDNIERYPQLLSFTGWYAVARNNLASADYVSLLEYDVVLEDVFSSKTLAALRRDKAVIGYVPFALSHPMYLHATPWLIRALAEVYQVDAVQLVRDHLAAGGLDQWTATTNASMSVGDLCAFVAWMLPLTRLYRHDSIGAHVQERALRIFCLLQNRENIYLPDLLTHAQARSHKIFALSREEAAGHASKLPPLL